MKPAPLAYVRPAGLPEALAVLADNARAATVLAGGQSLVPLLSMRLASPELLVDINKIHELNYVRTDDAGVRIGALARHSDVERDAPATIAQPLLRKALRLVAHPAIRNRGTTVGSIAHADPAAEMPMVLCLLGGSVTCVSASGPRVLAARDFILGPLVSARRAGELITEVFVPALAARSGTAITEVSRRRGDYALCGVAAVVELDADGSVVHARAGYLSVAEVPLVLDLTAALAGAATPAALARAAEVAVAAVQPETDIHASADYRRHLAGVLTRRVLADAHAEAAAAVLAARTESGTAA